MNITIINTMFQLQILYKFQSGHLGNSTQVRLRPFTTAIGTFDNQLRTCSILLRLCLACIASLTEREQILQNQACIWSNKKWCKSRQWSFQQLCDKMYRHFIQDVVLMLYLCHNSVQSTVSCYNFSKITHIAISYLYLYLCPCILALHLH